MGHPGRVCEKSMATKKWVILNEAKDLFCFFAG